jgi:fructose/tagatose bisphosphate aldolase
MIAAMSALGMGALCGAFMGANSTTLEIADKKVSLEAEVADAIGHGHWVIVVHTETEVAAWRARELMPNRRIVRGEEAAALEPSDAAAEQVDLNKLGKIVDDAFALVAKETSLPAIEVLCKVGEIELATLKKATDAAISKIAVATDLDTAQITDIFKANRAAGIDVVVNRLRERSLLNRAAW